MTASLKLLGVLVLPEPSKEGFGYQVFAAPGPRYCHFGDGTQPLCATPVQGHGGLQRRILSCLRAAKLQRISPE